MDRYLKISLSLLIGFLLVLLLQLLLAWRGTWNVDVNSIAIETETKLHVWEDDYTALVNDQGALEDLVKDGFKSLQLAKIQSKPYELLVFSEDQMLFWSRNDAIPPPFLAKALEEGSSFLKQQSGYYEILKTTRVINGAKHYIIGMILVYSYYPVQNQYLKDRFNPKFNMPEFVQLELDDFPDAVPVENKVGKTLFYLRADLFQYKKLPNYTLAWLQFAMLLFVLAAINAFAVFINRQSNGWWAFAFLVFFLAAIRAAMIWLDLPKEFGKLALFDPQYFASSTINKSLGDLLFNLLFLFNVTWFLFRYAPFRRLDFRIPIANKAITVASYILLFLSAYWIGLLFNSLMLNSRIPFDLNNFMSLTSYSLLGMLGISMLLLSYYLLTFKFVRYISGFKLSWRFHAITLFTLGLAFVVILYGIGETWVLLISVPWVLVYLVFMLRQVSRERDLTSFTNLTLLIILFAAFSSVHMYQYNQMRELEQRKSIARKLADQRDRITEYLFLDLQDRIFEDQFVKNYFLTPFVSTKDIIKRIRTIYFGGYFNKYDISIYLINKAGDLILGEGDSFFDLLDENAELTPPSDYLYFIPKTGGSYAYLCNLPILYKNKFIGTIIIEMNPKSYAKTNLYPELLLEEKIKLPEENDQYSNAVYENGNLIRKEGSFAYSYEFDFPKETTFTEEYFHQVRGDMSHLAYYAGNEKWVIISKKSDNWLQPVTLFSYLFGLYLLFAFLVLLIGIGVKLYNRETTWRGLFDLSFKDKIQYSMIAMLVFSFLTIGFVTLLHFRGEYDFYHMDRLIRKQIAIKSAIEYNLRQNDDFLQIRDYRSIQNLNDRQSDLPTLADVHNMDINIYDRSGSLINTSQPDIFEKGLLSDVINPVAYKELEINKRSQVLQTEAIGALSYLAIYVPLRNINGELVAYLNLPYFAREKELRGEISSFLVALINVYVLLLIAAGSIAYLLSRSITSPLSAISEKIKETQLGRKNEPIEWKNNDEIGKLVNEYNKMIGELEQSADLLARSERESAWREMAKQIAHEIKNPLTPMKLSIQHLQRAMADGRPNVEALAQRVMATMIEQIDSLSHIASEFSSFAKMPTAHNEVFDLAEIVASVADLFSDEQNVNILHTRGEPVWIYADKNQVLRVFNNLVKNAVQAIPDGREGTVEIGIERENHYTTAWVKDNGIGIYEDQRSRVFVPNFTTKSSGTGLGLAISKQIVENAGGEVWFTSEPEKGTTFFVKLPLHK
ncbi:HAMP domain-containing sensor histidine kinase [soil metagenome]